MLYNGIALVYWRYDISRVSLSLQVKLTRRG